jgi:mRNA-degrading endonuclease RelE of RelBE toxin-antitoxin system
VAYAIQFAESASRQLKALKANDRVLLVAEIPNVATNYMSKVRRSNYEDLGAQRRIEAAL